MINIKSATKSFDEFKAIKSVNLKIEKSHIHALLGPNGAGKTTLIRSLVGLYDIDEGVILIDNTPISRDNNILKSKIGVVSQHINLDKELTVSENLEFAGRLYKMKKNKIEIEKDKLLSFFKLSNAKDKQTKKLSGGMKRKLMIAKSLIHNPDLIILDEPTVGIDAKSRKEIWELLMQLKNEGKTILLTTHYIEEAEYLCDMITIIDNGTIQITDTINNLKLKLGKYCIEYFDNNNKINYKYFSDKDKAIAYSKNLKVESILKDTNLEDVFHNYIKEKVTDFGN